MNDKIKEFRKLEPVAWGIFYFCGKRNGQLYKQFDTEEKAEQYLNHLEQSNDHDTFRAEPIYTTPPASEATVPSKNKPRR